MQISVVIPTCNRKARLLSLLQQLDQSDYIFKEVIVVDSGEDRLAVDDYACFKNITVQYVASEKSVCLQRNAGIQHATGDWIFLCDDDIEVPGNYVSILAKHIHSHPGAGAVSGIVLQKEGEEWTGKYPVTSARSLAWTYFFQLSIWGEITCNSNNFLVKRVINYYKRKGNHISKAGWPVLVDFEGDFITTPVYGLGASLVKKEWLLRSPYDEVLDRHGIGDNYGVAVDFPVPIHVVANAFVYHHQETMNRLQQSVQYYRRTLALHYFIKTKPTLQHIKTYRLIWSLIGNLFGFIKTGNRIMIKAALQSIIKIVFNRNPYIIAHRRNLKIIEPIL